MLLTRILLIVELFVTARALICWSCNERSYGACLRNGKGMFCTPDTDICSTEVRWNAGHYRISKGCKQREACLNQQNQNWGNLLRSGKCKRTGKNSLCKCCCYGVKCNRKDFCNNRLASECRRVPDVLENGQVTCTRSTKVGSVCTFQCSQARSNDYSVLTPGYSNRITCLPNGKWDRPIPRCMKPCPPNMNLDIITVVHRKTEAGTIDFIKQTSQRFFRLFTVGPDSMRYARIHYSSYVHEPHLHFRDTINMTSEEIINYVETEFHEELEGNKTVNTGAALWYIYHNMVNAKGDRLDTRNIVYLSSDEVSDDDVLAPSRAIRSTGTVIITDALINDIEDRTTLNRQLLDMMGTRNQLRAIWETLFCEYGYPTEV